MPEKVYHGLEGVLAGESAICEVSHGAGGLSYRGYAIEDLAEKASFEEVAYLLLMGDLPNRDALRDFQNELIQARSISGQLESFLSEMPPSSSPMDVLRTAVSFLGVEDPERLSNGHAANLRKATRLIAQMPMLLELLQERPDGKGIPPPDRASKSHAAYLLEALTGDIPDPASVKVMEVSLILYAEHELNASTFAARVTASSMSDIYSAVTSATGALKGPLHGGANEAVMKMLLEVVKSGDVEGYLADKLAKKERVMGFGHRVLRREDPRSHIIKRYAKELGIRKGDPKWFEISEEIEAVMRREKRLYPNLDFYTASAYALLGLPTALYTPIFVCSRMAGWTAHIIEQLDHNRLIRPRCRYIGKKGRSLIPLEERD